MDAIEQRLTTDVTGAQAVVDLGKIVRNVELDQGRPVSLVRIGMVIDALSRYLVDGGAMLYGVVERTLLSEAALTSKERMVLGRWADDGLIEVIPVIGDRVLEIADITGLPIIAMQGDPSTHASPYEKLAGRYRWLADGNGRVLNLSHRSGVAVLTLMCGPASNAEVADSAAPAIGRAKVPESDTAEKEAPAQDVPEEPATGEPATEEAEPAAREPGAETPDDTATSDDAAVSEETAGEGDGEAEQTETTETTEAIEATEPAETAKTSETAETAETVPLSVAIFANRGVAPVARTRISWHRFARAEPNRAHETLLRRRWRCDEFECPVFGEHRRIGQPVPRLRAGVPTCPRHDEPVVDIGPREPSYPVSIVVDDLPRQRLVVRRGRPLAVGRGAEVPDDAGEDGDDPELAEVTSVAPWLHRAAAAWISPIHLRLEASDDGLIVTDVSDRGTVVWQRKGPEDRGTNRALRGESYPLGEWDSVELYTGIELMRGDRRLAAVLGRDELDSVLLDAPTAAHHQVHAG